MKIQNYEFGKIVINGKEYKQDLKIFSNSVKENWWRSQGHFLQVEDLEDVFNLKIKKLIIGKGYYGEMKVSDAVRKKAKELGIELIEKDSKEAIKEYENSDKENTILAIHLTC